MFNTKANIQDIYHNVNSFLCFGMIDQIVDIGPSFVISPSPNWQFLTSFVV